ncbi:hypothetical protein CRD60_07275 [Bifidobacterium aemilianum]|uniref:DUF4235 domain-containing protein n=1 Tax=Bifidobacterium aemilianum TaxID=2493120 RepID=A0A366K888_9BIFI|nr:DUF4235 domain-containing protein [Bifidobacterium aemilianum]RBP97333.1 hypothetical protein CRD60_07275 [Bifidobacterium aemilianum]
MTEAYKNADGPNSSQEPAESTADRIISSLHSIDEKVNGMRAARESDPDSIGDKLIKFALPTLAGLLGGKLFQTLWNKGVAGHKSSGQQSDQERSQGFAMSLIFAAASAAFGAVVSQLSDKGSQALVNHRQIKRLGK